MTRLISGSFAISWKRAAPHFRRRAQLPIPSVRREHANAGGFLRRKKKTAMSIAEQIDKDYIQAYKTKDQVRLGTLRLLKTAAKNRQVELMRPLEDNDYMDVLLREIKQRQDSIEQYTAAGRTDLAEKESAEASVLQAYLPAQLSEAELAEVVERTVAPLLDGGMKNMGKAISAIMAEYKGRVDGKAVSAAVKARLQQAR